MSCELTTPILRLISHLQARLATINPSTNFQVSISTHYEGMKRDTKCEKYNENFFESATPTT